MSKVVPDILDEVSTVVDVPLTWMVSCDAATRQRQIHLDGRADAESDWLTLLSANPLALDRDHIGSVG